MHNSAQHEPKSTPRPSPGDGSTIEAATAWMTLPAEPPNLIRAPTREGIPSLLDGREDTMTTTTAPRTEAAAPIDTARDPGFLAFFLLRTGFTVAPILFGIDKFFNWMVDWDRYLWSEIPKTLGISAQDFMHGVGAIEIVAGLVVLFAPQLGGGLVAAWLGAIIGNLVLQGEYWDIALRDFGLMLGAITLMLLATKYRPLVGRRRPETTPVGGRYG
jgi:hypothetical protein